MSNLLPRTLIACLITIGYVTPALSQFASPSSSVPRSSVSRRVQDVDDDGVAASRADAQQETAASRRPLSNVPATRRLPPTGLPPQQAYSANGQAAMPPRERQVPPTGAAPAPAPWTARPPERPLVHQAIAGRAEAPGAASTYAPTTAASPRRSQPYDVRQAEYQPIPEPIPDVPGERSLRAEGIRSLQELTLVAEQRHPILARAAAEIESAKGGRVQAGLYPNPRMETNNPEVFAGRNSQVNFGFQQDIVTKGKMRLEKAAADQQVRKMEAKYMIDRMRLLTAIRSQYYETLAAHQRVLVSYEFVRLSLDAYRTAQQLVDAGQGSSTDVLLISTELERARVNAENARTTLAGELAQLAAIVGDPNLRITELQGSIFDPLPRFNNEELRRFLVMQSNHMELGGAEISRNQMQLRREEVEPYPNLRVGPSYAMNTNDNVGQFWLSIVFDIPVWNLNQGNIRQARAEVQSAVADLDATRAELLRREAEVYARHVAARTVVERIRQTILPSAQKAQQQVGEGFAKGLFDVNRVLQARRSLLEANDDLIDALERAWSTAAELAGMLQEEQFP